MNDLIDRLEVAIRDYILEEMPDDPGGELAAMSFQELLISFGTWQSRLIPTQPRSCHVSRELRASPKAVEHRAELDVIVAKIKAGDDLTAHLSKGIDRPLGVDRMLADLGVYHLHLSTDLEPNGRFVQRGGDLLFAAFKPDDAYLIGFYEHATDWARQDILETIARNWPEAGIIHELKYVVGFTQTYSDEDRLALQQAGISTGQIEVDGKVFSTLGQSVAGDPYSAQKLRMTVIAELTDWRENLPDRLKEATAALNAAAGREVGGDWEPQIRDGIAGLQREEFFYPIVSLS